MNSHLHLPTDDLKAQYIERRRLELGVYLQALKAKDYEPIRHIGHRMRGNGISFGFPELSILGEKIEAAAAAGDLMTLRILSIEFTNWVDQQTGAGSAQ